jgi:hypothetical protein
LAPVTHTLRPQMNLANNFGDRFNVQHVPYVLFTCTSQLDYSILGGLVFQTSTFPLHSCTSLHPQPALCRCTVLQLHSVFNCPCSAAWLSTTQLQLVGHLIYLFLGGEAMPYATVSFPINIVLSSRLLS